MVSELYFTIYFADNFLLLTFFNTKICTYYFLHFPAKLPKHLAKNSSPFTVETAEKKRFYR